MRYILINPFKRCKRVASGEEGWRGGEGRKGTKGWKWATKESKI